MRVLDTEIWALIISLIAVATSGVAALYARQQARAGRAQAVEAKRSADIAESVAQAQRQDALERRLRESLIIDIRGDDPVKLQVSVRSALAEEIQDLTVTFLPDGEAPDLGFMESGTTSLRSTWHVGPLEPGARMKGAAYDLRRDEHDSAHIRLAATVEGTSCTWTEVVTIAHPPRAHFL